MKASKAILYSTSGFLVVIWSSSFIISYVSLIAVATAGGLTYPWVWLWPLLLDAFMCIGSLDVIRRELNGEPTIPAWIVVIGVTLVSTGFNITRADPSVLSWAVHALAPVVCFLSFEIEMGVLRSYFRQLDSLTEAGEPGEAETEAIPEPGSGDPETVVKDSGSASGPASEGSLTVVNSEPHGIVSVKEKEPRNVRKEITNYYQEHPNAGYAEAGRAVGVSRQVVRKHILKLAASQASRNMSGEITP